MNVKSDHGVFPSVLVGIVVGTAPLLITRFMDRGDGTAVALAELKVQVTGLREQLSKFENQPYVRRDDFESRVTGLDQRISNLERNEQQRSKR